jgi:hypothetical protein
MTAPNGVGDARDARPSSGGERPEFVAVNFRLPEQLEHVHEAVWTTLRGIDDLDTNRATAGGAIHQDGRIEPLRRGDAVARLPRQIEVGGDRLTAAIRHLQGNPFHHAVTLYAVITTITRSSSSA